MNTTSLWDFECNISIWTNLASPSQLLVIQHLRTIQSVLLLQEGLTCGDPLGVCLCFKVCNQSNRASLGTGLAFTLITFVSAAQSMENNAREQFV